MKETDILFTSGEFANKAGVTLRTIRYYDNIGLLKPSSHNSCGNRLYSIQDFVKLQKILTLKYIGLSLGEIKTIVEHEALDKKLKSSLELQKQIMKKKLLHMEMVINALEETINMVNDEDELNWDKFINIIKVINIDNNWREQYENASNLRARIKIHDLFSTNKYGWMKWFFEQMIIPENAKILEVGCGDGSLWKKNIDRIPSDWNVTLTDFSNGMLKDAKLNLKTHCGNFKFKNVDVENIPFKDNTFDIVIANHMLYHVSDRDKAFSEIRRVLKKGGKFYASTVGENHMIEFKNMIKNFDPKITFDKSWDVTKNFQLENGKEQLSKWFSDISVKKYTDSLNVTEPSALIDYIFSMSDDIKKILDTNKIYILLSTINNEIAKSGGIYISKDTGFFQSIKL